MCLCGCGADALGRCATLRLSVHKESVERSNRKNNTPPQGGREENVKKFENNNKKSDLKVYHFHKFRFRFGEREKNQLSLNNPPNINFLSLVLEEFKQIARFS